MNNSIYDTSLKLGSNVTINEGIIIGKNVVIEDDVYLDYGCIIRDNVHIKKGSYIGARCILGEYLMDFFEDRKNKEHKLIIGENSIIRSECIIYGDTEIGDNFQTGHRVTIREKATIGNHVRIGTLSDIQGDCHIGNYVSIHSNVFISQMSLIKDYVWIFCNVKLTNDPTPPSDTILGVTVESFSVIATAAVILPGVRIMEDSLIGAGSVVTRDVPREAVVTGNPAKILCSIRDIRNKISGELVYPWRDTFKKGMPWQENDFQTWINEFIRNK